LTAALLDRLTYRIHIWEMNGESYRLPTSKKRQKLGAKSKPEGKDDAEPI